MSFLAHPQTLAKVLHWATVAAMILLPLGTAGLLLTTPPTPATVGGYFLTLPVSDDISQVMIYAALLVGVVPLLILLWTLNQMRHLFAGFLTGDVLTQPAATRILRIGQGLLCLAIVKILSYPAQVGLLTWENPPGQRMLSIGLSSEQIGFILGAGLLTVIGWAMRDAAMIAEENRGFI